jgi:hypothetical protein
MRVCTGDERVKQAAIATAILAGVGCGVVALLLGGRLVPGVLGEWLGTLAGIASTPFLLEPALALCGVLVVIVLNTVRRQREGDDFLSHEQLTARGRVRANAYPPPAGGARAAARISPGGATAPPAAQPSPRG